MGAQAEPATEDLLNALWDESDTVRDHASRALGRIGPAAEGSLVEFLISRDDNVRLAAVRVFAEHGVQDPNAIESLECMTEDPEATIRAEVVAVPVDFRW